MNRADALSALTAAGEPFEVVEAEVGGQKVRVFRNGPATLRDLFEESRSARPFIVFQDETTSFDEVWIRSSAVAHGLATTFDVKKGDRVAIAMRNCSEWIIAFQAVTMLGAIVVALNAHWSPDELAFGLKDSGAKLLFADEQRARGLRELKGDWDGVTVVVGTHTPTTGTPRFEEVFGTGATKAAPEASISADDDATILYTSGSTGRPKGVVSTHRNIITTLQSWELDNAALALMAGTEAQASGDTAALLSVPLFHVTGLHAVYLASLRAQRRLVMMQRWDAREAARLIEKERVTHLTAPAAITGDLVEIANAGGFDLSSLGAIGGGGSARAPNQVREINRLFTGALPVTGWGMTETNASGTSIFGAEYLARPESSGRASHMMDLRVVDDEGQVLPTGTPGELQVRGASVMRDYWHRPEARAEAFDMGWFRTGDVSYLDQEGYLFIVDRIKELVIRGGENIGCGLVEAALLEHPAVIEAVVYGLPDNRLGERVGATIRVAEPVDLDQVKSFLAGRLARFQIPEDIRMVTSPLARTESGKVLRREIRSEALAEGR